MRNIIFPHQLGAKKQRLGENSEPLGPIFVVSQASKIIAHLISYMDVSF